MLDWDGMDIFKDSQLVRRVESSKVENVYVWRDQKNISQHTKTNLTNLNITNGTALHRAQWMYEIHVVIQIVGTNIDWWQWWWWYIYNKDWYVQWISPCWTCSLEDSVHRGNTLNLLSVILYSHQHLFYTLFHSVVYNNPLQFRSTPNI